MGRDLPRSQESRIAVTGYMDSGCRPPGYKRYPQRRKTRERPYVILLVYLFETLPNQVCMRSFRIRPQSRSYSDDQPTARQAPTADIRPRTQHGCNAVDERIPHAPPDLPWPLLGGANCVPLLCRKPRQIPSRASIHAAQRELR